MHLGGLTAGSHASDHCFLLPHALKIHVLYLTPLVEEDECGDTCGDVFSRGSHSRMPYIQSVNYHLRGTGHLPTFHFVIVCLGERLAHKTPILFWHEHNIRLTVPLPHRLLLFLLIYLFIYLSF